MHSRNLIISGVRSMTLCSLMTLAACNTKPAPAPLPPPPPAVVIPPRPYPPLGAAPNLVIPQLAADGTRLTINSGLTSKQALWNLRSAYNVAALNCQKPAHKLLSGQYSEFLKTHKKLLASVYRDLDKQFKQVHGAAYIHKREAFQTQVYNYFAFPPVLPAFCDSMMTVGQDLTNVPSKNLEAQSPIELAKLEKLYQDFFISYEKYRSNLATWEVQYGSTTKAWSASSATPAAQ